MTELTPASQNIYGAPGFSGAVHASSVAIDGYAILIAGPSGAGKSDLMLRLIDRGALLISDDYTWIERSGEDEHSNDVIASAPETTSGRIEVRGLGIVDMPHVDAVKIAMIVIALADGEQPPERYPLCPVLCRICGTDIPALSLFPLEPSAPIKVELALHHFTSPLSEQHKT